MMIENRGFFCGLVLALGLAAGAMAGLSEVNPMIGTGGIGYGVGSAYPGPSLPFGMARPGPDTSWFGTHVSFHHCGGYHYNDNMIRGFSHTRLSGIGVTEYGNVRVMPTLVKRDDYSAEWTYASLFSHDDETARPGYYSVLLKSSGIRVELTAAARAALHRYTFPRGPGRIVIDADSAIMKKQSCGGEIFYDEDRGEFFGRTINCGSLTGRSGGVEVFFALRADRAALAHGFFGEESEGAGARGKRAGAWFEVEAGPEDPVLLMVGLSFISVEQARRHLEEELMGRSFEEARGAAESAWQSALSVIEFKGGSSEERTIFYTALYHAQLMPTHFTESGGVYLGFDGEVHEAGEFEYYTDFSLWDTFRTLHPLLFLLEPVRSRDMMQSLTRMAEQGGYLPRWPTANRYTNCMLGANADNVLAEAYLKGVRGFDHERAYQAARWLALNPVPAGEFFTGRVGLEDYLKLGYVPADRHGWSASWTIEMSYNDWCLAQWARARGDDDDYRRFMARSKNWRNLWDPRTGFLRGRDADGSFKGPFLASSWTGYYAEGNARQWLWAPFHDVEGLIELMGGKEKFAARLEEFFEKSATRPDTLLWDTFYWHGNEPDIHAAYLFLFVDRPELTQKWVRWVMAEKYKNAPDGLDGNDDAGTLSAWFVFSALGFYPLAGSDLYLIGSPLFEEAVIHLPAGDLIIRAENDPSRNPYVKGASLNGRPLAHPWLRHEQIASGGELVFEMSAAPSAWPAGGFGRP